jgi:hypothetical protein
MSHCALCEDKITNLNDSKEHIVPHAVGGRRKVRGFICRTCNNTGGRKWDAKLAEQYNWFSVALNIKRESGAPPSQPIKTVSGQGLILHADGTMSPDKPEIVTTDTPAGRRISIKARTMAEARKILLGIQRKYPNNDLSNALETMVEQTTTPDGPILTSFEFGGTLAGRSIVKTAVAMACKMSLPYKTSEYALRYLKDETATPAFAEFLLRDLVLNRPDSHIFHAVSVAGDPAKRRLIAYVEYFGLSRFVVHLSSDYEGPAIQKTYSLNPVSGEELNIAVDLLLSDDEYVLSQNNDAVPTGAREAAFHDVMPIVLRSMYAREDKRVLEQAIDEAFRELGAVPDQELRTNQIEEFSRRLAHKLTPYVLRVLKNRPRL